jgi:hypothetical protein
MFSGIQLMFDLIHKSLTPPDFRMSTPDFLPKDFSEEKHGE